MTHLPPSEVAPAANHAAAATPQPSPPTRPLPLATTTLASVPPTHTACSVRPPLSWRRLSMAPLRAPRLLLAPPDAPTPAPWTAPRGVQLTGPWVAGAVYGVVPAGPLAVVPEANQVHTGKWYAITRGRYVGVTHSTAICDAAEP
ncbi:hypothetical protein DFH06DRAFT_1325574 [Mycena polygramma]|nr:hypothetical protein DFH06DRAFT_1325574 [Mycena polygramma]